MEMPIQPIDSSTPQRNKDIKNSIAGVGSCSSSVLKVPAVDNKKYAVIEFVLGNIVYVSSCPIAWINGGNCLWPAKKGIERKAIVNNMKPEDDWLCLENIKVLGKYSTYKEALYKEKQKSKNDDSSSDPDDVRNYKRKVRPNTRYRDDSISPPPHEASEDLPDSDQYSSGSENAVSNHFNHEAQNNNFNIEDLLANANIEIIDTDADNTLVNSKINSKNCDDLWQLLVEVKIKQDLICERLEHLEKMMACNGAADVGIPRDNILPKFPLNSLLEMNQFEEQLMAENVQICLLKYLQFIGGNNAKLCVSRCLDKIFSNYLGQFCSWTGKGGNLKISGTTVIEIVKRAVKVSFPVMTDNAFEGFCRAWFNHSKTRFIREEKKKITE